MKKFKIGEIVEAERKKIPEKSTQSWNTEPKAEEKCVNFVQFKGTLNV